MKKSLVITVVACVMLVATGFAANVPMPDQRQYVGSQTQDLHFQHYEEIRPFLISNQRASTAMCDYDKAEHAARTHVGIANLPELPGYAY